jgi:lipopolysaccharide/colanic/teichoic acid biosynthesis glycosyltransferase
MTDSSSALVGRPQTSTPLSERSKDPRSVEAVRHVGIRVAGFGRPIPEGKRDYETPPRWHLYETIKRIVEFLAAVVLLILTAPLMLLSAVAIKMTSRGPAFYTQMRVGRHGRPFPILKLRTMTHNCEASSGVMWCTAGDPRITAVGSVLRTTHLDELPQLWNVLCGHMSLIGPRPERPEFLPVLEQAIGRYRDRLQVRPGVTGLAQVQLPADTDLTSVRKKLAYDLHYIEHMTPWLDFRILLATTAKVFGAPFSVSRWLFFLPRQDDVLPVVLRARPPRPSQTN